MDFTQILTTLWGKISKPLPNILVGLVFVFLAPKFVSWLGFIFIAIGLASVIEFCIPRILSWKKKHALRRLILSLSKDEIKVLQDVRRNEGLTIESGNQQLQQILASFWKFEGLGLVYSIKNINYYDEHTFTFRLYGETERALKDILKRELD